MSCCRALSVCGSDAARAGRGLRRDHRVQRSVADPHVRRDRADVERRRRRVGSRSGSQSARRRRDPQSAWPMGWREGVRRKHFQSRVGTAGSAIIGVGVRFRRTPIESIRQRNDDWRAMLVREGMQRRSENSDGRGASPEHVRGARRDEDPGASIVRICGIIDRFRHRMNRGRQPCLQRHWP